MGWWRDRRVVGALAVAYALVLAVLVTGPWGWMLNRLTVRLYTFFRDDWPIAPDGALPEHYGYLLNVVLFVPMGALLVVVARWAWWWATCAGVLASTVVEVVQWLWLDRQGDWRDVVANGLGALVGAAAATLISPRARRR